MLYITLSERRRELALVAKRHKWSLAKALFHSPDCTVILLDDQSAQDQDIQLHSISHGVVMLEQLALD